MEISNDLSAMVKFLCPCSGMVINPSQSVKNKFHRPQPLGILPIPYESHGFSTRWFSMVFISIFSVQGQWLMRITVSIPDLVSIETAGKPRNKTKFWGYRESNMASSWKVAPLMDGSPWNSIDRRGFPIDMFDCQRVAVVSCFLKTSLKSIEFDVPNFQPTLAFHWSGDVYIYILYLSINMMSQCRSNPNPFDLWKCLW